MQSIKRTNETCEHKDYVDDGAEYETNKNLLRISNPLVNSYFYFLADSFPVPIKINCKKCSHNNKSWRQRIAGTWKQDIKIDI